MKQIRNSFYGIKNLFEPKIKAIKKSLSKDYYKTIKTIGSFDNKNIAQNTKAKEIKIKK